MKMARRFVVFAMCWLAIGFVPCEGAQESAKDKDEDPLVLHFEPLAYPTPAAARHIQGAVVVQVTLDKDGAVTDAKAISSEPSDLTIPAVNNAKKWLFESSLRKTAVIVYSFIILDGRCVLHSSLFVLQGKNLATVISCPPNVNP